MNSSNDKIYSARLEVEAYNHQMNKLSEYDRGEVENLLHDVTLTYAVLAAGVREASYKILDAKDMGNTLLLHAAQRQHELTLIDMRYCHELTKILTARLRAWKSSVKGQEG